MADLLTATYDFVLPEVGGSDNTWGTKLNANFTALDLLLSSFFRGGSAGDPGDVQPFTISDAAPLLWFKETDQTAPEGYYRMGVQSDIFTLQRAVSADFVIAENVWIARGNAAVKSLEVPSPYFFHVSGGLTQVSGATPTIRFLETDAISPLGRWRIAGYGGGALSIARATAADFSAETNYLLFGFTPDVMAAAVPLTINTTSNINFQASAAESSPSSRPTTSSVRSSYRAPRRRSPIRSSRKRRATRATPRSARNATRKPSKVSTRRSWRPSSTTSRCGNGPGAASWRRTTSAPAAPASA
jgi:hypothetical protein